MTDDLVRRLRAKQRPAGSYFERDVNGYRVAALRMEADPDCLEAADRIEALEAVAAAAHGLSFGTDWNNGSHAKMHGYRNALLVALARLMGGKASPAAIRALKEKE